MFAARGNTLNLCNRILLAKRCSSFVNTKLEYVQLNYLEGADSGIVTVGLNRPETRNALSRNLVSNFFQAIETIKVDKKIRVVIIKSMVPGAFCAGADLKERLKLTDTEVKDFSFRLRSFTNAVHDLPIPVIAAVDGFALGGGLELALACDIRTSSSNAKIGLVETKLAIIPGAGGTQRLPRIVGPAIAKELIFTGRILSGTEAFHLGIVNHVTEQNADGNAAYLKALEIAREIILNGPVGVRMAKVAINSGLEVDISTGFVIEGACYAQIIPTKDRIEGLKAFQEKRAPKYLGQ